MHMYMCTQHFPFPNRQTSGLLEGPDHYANALDLHVFHFLTALYVYYLCIFKSFGINHLKLT